MCEGAFWWSICLSPGTSWGREIFDVARSPYPTPRMTIAWVCRYLDVTIFPNWFIFLLLSKPLGSVGCYARWHPSSCLHDIKLHWPTLEPPCLGFLLSAKVFEVTPLPMLMLVDGGMRGWTWWKCWTQVKSDAQWEVRWPLAADGKKLIQQPKGITWYAPRSANHNAVKYLMSSSPKICRYVRLSFSLLWGSIIVLNMSSNHSELLHSDLWKKRKK